MAGYKQWADGDALLPSEIDEYLMGQTLMRFATATARNAVLSSPVAGMRCFLGDTGLTYEFDGNQWIALLRRRKKLSAQSVTSSTTLVDDADLKVTLVPGQYFVDAWLHVSGGTTGDIKVTWTFSGTFADSARMCQGPTRATTQVEGGDGINPVTAAVTVGVNRSSAHFLTSDVPYGLDASSTSGIHEHLSLDVSAGGVLKLRWAQETSSGTATTVSAASHLRIERAAADA
jgi:hypothetical protein